ncbi:hypothetical protein [Albibacterium profundi]|uniref:Uncharacterized protein n=1 Tax=Albibacterium profundi TaxID=3134906 RepID=A0ABV5CEA6_9SPHI
MKKLKLNLDELSRELEVLEIDYLKGIKGGYGTPDGGDDDYGTFYGGYGTPDNPIELDPVEIYGGYDDYGSGGGSVFPPGWVPPYDPGDDNYLPGMGGDDGGYGGYNGYDPDFMQDVQDFFNSDPVGQMSDVMNAMGLANGIQELNHSAINALITATGGENNDFGRSRIQNWFRKDLCGWSCV